MELNGAFPCINTESRPLHNFFNVCYDSDFAYGFNHGFIFLFLQKHGSSNSWTPAGKCGFPYNLLWKPQRFSIGKLSVQCEYEAGFSGWNYAKSVWGWFLFVKDQVIRKWKILEKNQFHMQKVMWKIRRLACGSWWDKQDIFFTFLLA